MKTIVTTEPSKTDFCPQCDKPLTLCLVRQGGKENRFGIFCAECKIERNDPLPGRAGFSWTHFVGA